MALATLTIDVNARLANLEKDLGRVSHLAEQSAARMGGAFKAMNTAFASLAGIGAGAAFSGMIKSGIDLQDELMKLSSAYGINAREAAGLKFAADQNGASLDIVAKATKELMLNMAAAPDKFAKLGINATTATGALAQVADLVEKMPAGQQKVALLAELMGKKLGPEMSEFLSQGGESLRQYIAKGQDIYKVTDKGAANAKAFKDQMAELEARTQGVAVSLATNLLPGLNETAKSMNDLAEKGHPVLALWRGLAGMGQVPWDLLMPPENIKESLSSQNMIKDLELQIGQLQRNKASGNGKLMQWIFGTPQEIDAQIVMLQGRIDTIKKHATELDKKPTEVKKKTAPIQKEEVSGLQTLIALEKDYQAEIAKRVDALNAPLLSASERLLADDLRAVSKRAQDARVELEKQRTTQNITLDEYNARLADVTKKEQEQTDAIKGLRTAQDQLNGTWQYGAQIALRTYLDEVSNVSTQTGAMVSRAFKGMEDALVQFVRTGKLDFKSLTDSIINDLIRMQVQQSVMGPLAKYAMGLFGSGSAPVANITGSTSIGYNPSILDSIINGQRATGGPVSSNSLYQVNEKGPELLNYGGADYLMMGGKGGFVKPLSKGINSSAAPASAPSVTIQLINQSGQSVTAKQQGGPQFDGRDWVIGVVLEAADNNPHFRNAMGMA